MTSTQKNPRTDGDGVRVFERPKQRHKAAIALLAAAVAASLAVLAVWSRQPEATVPEAATATTALVTPSTHGGDGEKNSWAVPGAAQRRDERIEEGSGGEEKQPQFSMREMIESMRAIGETGGIAAFNPPGTDPIKIGLVVPEDFELPEGYLRHYQITDGGERLEPILMFSPDHEFVDASGNPVALPESGIVPPEMAPPGLPLRTLGMPKDPYGRGERAEAARRE